ncbi:MAG: 5,10-methylenetetrahydromethanopterin reductase [Gammaproteobacteria bacterium]|jgi:5,10-methylenetetrahydromethanopterin reductase
MNSNALEFWHFARPVLSEIEALAQHCEALGYDGLTVTDSQNLSADIYVAMTLAARATSTLLLGPGVTNPLTRHAAVSASAIAAIQEVSQGRAMLGIGRGDSSLFNIGHKPVAPAVFERYVADLQTYLRGDSLDAHGYESKIRWLANSRAPKVPVDVAATGPKVIATGARLAERVSFSLGADPYRVAWGIEQVRGAVGDTGAMPSLGVYVNVCVHDDVERAAELVRPGVGIFAHFTGMPGATRERVNANDHAMFERLGNYDKVRHGSGDAAHAQALSLDFIQRFAVVGPAQDCIEKLSTLHQLGIDRIFVIGPREDHFGEEATLAKNRFANEVIPALRAL